MASIADLEADADAARDAIRDGDWVLALRYLGAMLVVLSATPDVEVGGAKTTWNRQWVEAQIQFCERQARIQRANERKGIQFSGVKYTRPSC